MTTDLLSEEDYILLRRLRNLRYACISEYARQDIEEKINNLEEKLTQREVRNES